MVRKPVVAGVFYPIGEEMLMKTIEDSFLGPLGPGRLPERSKSILPRPIGAIVPHAGYVYSGQVAAWTYEKLASIGKPKTVIIMGPNHTGYGPPVSVFPDGKWITPLGEVEVDSDAAQLILENSDVAQADTSAHMMEHSIEVQLPFLQYIYKDGFKIVPITMMDQSPKAADDLSRAINRYITIHPPTLVMASTDLNHYEDHKTTSEKDKLIIQAIEQMDPRLLYSSVYEAGVSMCGYGPVAVLLLLNLGKPKILKHATSGEVSGDYLEVVGYLSAIFE